MSASARAWLRGDLVTYLYLAWLACSLARRRRFPRHEDLWDLHGRREKRVRSRAEERVGVDLILPGVHGQLPVQHLHTALAHTGCGAKRCEVEAVGL